MIADDEIPRGVETGEENPLDLVRTLAFAAERAQKPALLAEDKDRVLLGVAVEKINPPGLVDLEIDRVGDSQGADVVPAEVDREFFLERKLRRPAGKMIRLDMIDHDLDASLNPLFDLIARSTAETTQEERHGYHRSFHRFSSDITFG
jgi:hypothetical protein